MRTERLEEIEKLCKANEGNTSTCEIIRELIGAVRTLPQSPAEVKEQLRQLAEEHVYNGNSVSYIYSKMENYKKVIGECCALFQMDGTKSVVDYIKELQSQLIASHAENARLRDAAEKTLLLLNMLSNIASETGNCSLTAVSKNRFDAIRNHRELIREALTTTTPNPIEQELTELRRDKQTLIDAAWHFHNCKYCGEGSPCDDGAAHGERLLAISDTASKEAKRE
jgi:hypothetical protein